MRRAVAAIAALAVTLGLFFLMHLLTAGDGDSVPRPMAGGGVGLVTLVRDQAGGAAQGGEQSPPALAPLPAPLSQPPTPPAPTMAQIFPPPEPDLTLDTPAFEVPAIDAVPYLGGPPVVVAEKPAAQAETKTPKKKIEQGQIQQKSDEAIQNRAIQRRSRSKGRVKCGRQGIGSGSRLRGQRGGGSRRSRGRIEW